MPRLDRALVPCDVRNEHSAFDPRAALDSVHLSCPFSADDDIQAPPPDCGGSWMIRPPHTEAMIAERRCPILWLLTATLLIFDFCWKKLLMP